VSGGFQEPAVIHPTDDEEWPEVAVPGSISNLGPGLDALSLAVQLYLRVRIVEVRPEAPDTLSCDFGDRPIAGTNLVEAAYRQARAACGVPAPGLAVEVRSDIPLRAGLGSSGAATVAGLRLYELMTGAREIENWLRLACRLEGHPDNAAAALLGGLTVSCQHGDGRVTARTSAWPEEIRLVVATPHLEVATGVARSVLPATIAFEDAVFNLQHALLLVHAVRSGQPQDLREALRDRWHQSARATLVPGLTEALALDDPALLGVCLSGSGPSIAAFAGDGVSVVTELLTDLYERISVPCTIRVLAAHQPSTPGSGASGPPRS
jgi:homoserine kinase